MYPDINTMKARNTIENKSSIQMERLTALWALSEAALGGVLHAFQIPFTGLIINSSAVILISLIAFYSDGRNAIFKSTLVVLIVKASVSPHTPLNAYMAVTLQGLIASALFSTRKFFKISALILGITTLLLSAFQKIIVLTIVFGKNLWESIDLFANTVIGQFSFLNISAEFSLSIWLIIVYGALHLIAGFVSGYYAAILPVKITKRLSDLKVPVSLKSMQSPEQISVKRKKKFWLRKPTGIFILTIAGTIFVLSYFTPVFESSQGRKALIMILRSVVIMIVWFKLLAPVMIRLYRRFLTKKKNFMTRDVDRTMHLLPAMRLIIFRCWHLSANYKGFKRFTEFVALSLVNILAAEIDQNYET